MAYHPAHIPRKAQHSKLANSSADAPMEAEITYSSTLNQKQRSRKRRKKARAVRLQHQEEPLSKETSTTVNLIQETAICSDKIKCTIGVIHRQTKIVPVKRGVNIKMQ